MRAFAMGTLVWTLFVVSAQWTDAQERRAYRQPTVPEGWKELRYAVRSLTVRRSGFPA